MGFNPKTYRLDTQADLWELMDAAVAALEAGKQGIFTEVDNDAAARSLVLRLHKFRHAFEAQYDEAVKFKYAGLKISPALISAGHEFPGVTIAIAEHKPWKITVLE